MPLQHTCRPKTLEEVFGNESTIASLQSVLSRETDVPHVFMFTGLPGTGKTTLGLIIKDILGCSKSDFYYHNTSKDKGIDVFRKIQDDCQFAPMSGKIKVYLFEEAHEITGPALDSMLQFLEFIPKHIYMIFCTSEPEKWPAKKAAALARRCHSYELKPLNTIEMNAFLISILEKEGVEDPPDELVQKIISVAEGSPGIALKLLDLVIDIGDLEQSLEIIDSEVVTEATIIDIARVLNNGNGQWSSIAKMIKDLSGEPERLRRAFLGYFEKVLLDPRSNHERIAEMMMMFMEPVFNTGKPGLTLAIYLASKVS